MDGVPGVNYSWDPTENPEKDVDPKVGFETSF